MLITDPRCERRPSKRRDMQDTQLICVFALIFSLGGCAPSEAEVKRDFAKAVAASNSCNTANDCALASVDCPLGCAVAVNRNQVARIGRIAKDLIEDYERNGRSCAYDCFGPREIVCREQHCAFEEPDGSSTMDAGSDAAR